MSGLPRVLHGDRVEVEVLRDGTEKPVAREPLVAAKLAASERAAPPAPLPRPFGIHLAHEIDECPDCGAAAEALKRVSQGQELAGMVESLRVRVLDAEANAAECSIQARHTWSNQKGKIAALSAVVEALPRCLYCSIVSEAFPREEGIQVGAAQIATRSRFGDGRDLRCDACAEVLPSRQDFRDLPYAAALRALSSAREGS